MISTWITPSLSSNINSYAAHSAKHESPLLWLYSPVGPYQHVSIKAAEKDSWCLRGLECIFLLQCRFQSKYSTWLLISLSSSPSFFSPFLFLPGKKSLAPSQSMDKHFQYTSLYTFFCCVYLQTPLCRENCPQSKHILTALVYIITFKWSIKRLQIYLKIQSYEISLQRQKFT